MFEIESKHNPKFKKWLSLLESKGIRKEGLCIVSGEKLLRELISQQPDIIEDILLPPKSAFTIEDFRTTRLSSPLFQELDVVGTRSPLAVVRTPAVAEWTPGKPQGLEIIVSLGDPSNLGALLRSAEAFGARRVILTRECASPFLPKAIKGSSLASLRLPLAQTGSIKDLKLDEGYALDMEGEDLASFKWPKDAFLVLGEEGQGLPQALNLKRLKIPIARATESLNATVAASIALYSYRQSQ